MDAPSNTLALLPENPFYDQSPPTGSSAVPHTEFDFPAADEYPGHSELQSLVFPRQNQLQRMNNIRSYLQEWVDVIQRLPLFTDEVFQQLSIPPVRTSQPKDTPVSMQIRSLAKSLEGSTKLKLKIMQNNPQTLRTIVSAIVGHVYDLIFDEFGSCFLGTLFESMADEYIERILRELLLLQQRFRAACMHEFGHMAVIKLIRRLQSPYHQSILTNVMRKHSMALTKSSIGSEVLCECFYILSPQHIRMLMTEIVEKCFAVATDKIGCRVLQSCMRYCDDDTICDLLIEVAKYAVILSEHPYGNYVVQRVVELVRDEYISAGILCKLEGHFVDMSMNKFASHVVEKCINDFPDDEAAKVVREFIDSSRLVAVCQNSFGNYVIQCALKRFTGSILQQLIACIDRCSTSLKSHPYSREVVKTANARKQSHLLMF